MPPQNPPPNRVLKILTETVLQFLASEAKLCRDLLNDPTTDDPAAVAAVLNYLEQREMKIRIDGIHFVTKETPK